MPGAEVRRYSTDRRGLALNLFLGVVGGALAALAESLLLPIVVLALFVATLTDSFVAVGFVPAIGVGLWALGRLPAGLLAGGQRRKQPWAVGAALVRATATGLLALVCFRVDAADLGTAAGPLLRSFFICWVAYAFAGGFASVPSEALLAKAMPDEGRALFYRQRALWAGLAAILGGLAVAQLLGENGPPFPRNFALLFLAATVAQLATVFFLATLREPVRIATAAAPSPLSVLRALPEALADAGYRRFLFFRVLLSLSALIDPFLVVFAVARLGVSPVDVGAYVLAFVLGRLLAAPVWAVTQRRYGDKAILQTSSLLRLLPPSVALTLPYLGDVEQLRDPFAGGTVLSFVVGAAFFVLGAAASAQGRANFGYLADVAAPRLRSLYAGVTNVVLTVVAVAPVVGGVIAARYGYEPLFLVGASIGLLAVFASGPLMQPFVRSRRGVDARRVRRPLPRPAGTAVVLPDEAGRR